MIVLALETSCDETAAAVVQNGQKILSSSIGTQFDIHKKYSGVVPELASRAHVLTVNSVIKEVLSKAWPKLSTESALKKIDLIGVTVGPGLVGSLLVGKMTAETLGWVTGIPVMGVNHIEGHLLSPVLMNKHLKPPFLGLVVSGGHSELILCKRWGQYQLVGQTRDDAAGEAFDKVAKMMNLGYPGGPVIDKLAKLGRADKILFPRPWLEPSWDFSFSGLKTSVLYRLRELKKLTLQDKKDVSAGFQNAVVEVLVGKTIMAAKALKVSQIVVGGGVSANGQLREDLQRVCLTEEFKLSMVPPALCTDNAAMIGTAAYFKANLKNIAKNKLKISIQPNLRISKLRIKLPPFKRPSS